MKYYNTINTKSETNWFSHLPQLLWKNKYHAFIQVVKLTKRGMCCLAISSRTGMHFPNRSVTPS